TPLPAVGVGALDGANGTVCFVGATPNTLTYVGSNGTYVNGNFSLTLQNHDVNGAADGITFNGVTGGDGFINLTGDSDVDGNGGNGITSSATDSNTEIIIEDSSSVTGSVSGIVANSGGAAGGNIKITTEAGTPVVGESGNGIMANASTLGNVVIDAQGVVTGTGGNGIVAVAAGGTVDVTTGAGAVTGTNGSGIDATASGNVTVGTGGNITGTVGNGINAVSTGNGSVQVTTSGAAGTLVSGANGDGINADAPAGNVVVEANTAVTGSVIGIDANAGGTVSVTTGAGFAVTGNGGDGIQATSGTGTTVDVNGNVTGTGGNGILATATNGAVQVTTEAGTLVQGTGGAGISASATLAGNVTVTANSQVTGSTIGIDASTLSGSIQVTTGTAAILGQAGHGIDATGTTSVTVGTGGNVTGTGGIGINAVSSAGNVSVTTNGAAGTLISGTSGAGINATSSGAAATVDVEVHTAVTGSTIGINALSNNGSVEVTTDQYAVNGQAGHGISAVGANAVTVGTGGNVTGTGGIGINAVSTTSGNVNVTTNGAAGTLISGTAGAGIFANADGTGNTDVEVHTAVTGSTIGIDANADSGTVEVTTDQYAVTGQFGAGIDATASGLVTVSTGGNVTGNGIGINAVSGTNGNVNVTTNGAAGTLISGTAGAGIFANADGTGNTDVEIHTAVTGSTIGIDANADSGTVEVTTDTGNNVAGNAGDGIQATASGNATVATKGDVIGTGGNGINAQSSAGGNVQVTTSLSDPVTPATVVNGTAGAGILAAATGTGTVTIINDTFTKGSVAGIDASSGTGAIQITNTRVIANLSNLETDLAIRTAGGPTTIDNNVGGGIIGRVETGVSDDTLNNSFFWFTNGISDFGAGANDAVNNSYYIFAGNQSGVAETTTFNGLENLNNNTSGVIQMTDQGAGDGSNISDVLRTSGNYNGLGGELGVDAFLGGAGSVADVLSIGGNATGTTAIFVNDTNAGPGGYNPDGILVAHVDGTTSADNFVLANGPIDKGLFFYDLLFDAANGDHLLVGLPDREVFETLAAVSSSQEIWRESADAWSTRQENLRDVLATRQVVTGVADPAVVEDDRPMGSLWVSALGSWAERDNDASFSILNGSFEFDTSYQQDIYGVVGGADFRADMGGDTSMLFGVMGGYVDSKLNFDESSTSIDTNGGTVGAYAALMSGGFFATVLVKADLLNMDYTVGSLAEDDNDDANVTTWGVRGDLGYRFGDSLFVEPMLSLDGISTKIDEFTIGGVDIDAGTNESFRGGAGVRAGYSDDTFRASATARVWDVFSTDNEVDVLADVPLGITDDGMEGVYGDVSGQIDVNLSTSATVYLKGGILFSDDVTKPNASGGFAFYW
ncbi:MAG: beta strand repeat-containing protein, partial [Pseudomonadota bacterium]